MLSCQRARFLLPADVHYLNCAFMAPLASAVRAAGIRGIDRRAAPHRLRPEDFFDESDRLRALFARVIHAPDPQRVAIVPSVSYGLGAVARNVPVSAGDNVVVLEEQFPSNVYVWRRLCAERGAALRTVEAPAGDAPSRGRAWNARLLSAIDRRTALVAAPCVHWADGTRFDIEAVAERARDCDARLVIDGTQSVGAMPFDVERLRPDALVCAGYKWLLGPYSTGLAWYGPAFDDGAPIEENWITRRGSEAFAELVRYRDEYQPGALRYDVGERSNFVLLPMLVAALELVLEWTVPAIEAYCGALSGPLTRALRERGHMVEDADGRGAHLFGVRLHASVDRARLAERLQARQVAVSFRGDAIRVAPHLYNDADDAAALLDAIG